VQKLFRLNPFQGQILKALKVFKSISIEEQNISDYFELELLRKSKSKKIKPIDI
jgi:hypothetical protein